MNSFKEQCIKLRERDHTLGEIVEITGKPKTSVFFHIQHIPLSEKRKREARKITTQKIIEFNKTRKGKSLRTFTKFTVWNKEVVYLVAHLLFDGQITQRSCMYHNRSKVLIERVRQCMEEIYLYEPKESVNTNTNVIRLGYYNVALATYLKQKSKKLLCNTHKLSTESKRAFVRAFFDDEGCMDFRPNISIRRVRGYQNDKKVLKIIHALLKDFDIDSSFEKSYVNEVVITGKENLIKFRDEINFSSGVKINGKRSNSIWKKDLEKKKILDMAIDSYQS